MRFFLISQPNLTTLQGVVLQISMRGVELGRRAFYRRGSSPGSGLRKGAAGRCHAHTTPHFASPAGDLGFSELMIAALLGHSARGVTQTPAHPRRGRAGNSSEPLEVAG